MGLEFVELVLAIEERFRIDIPDAEAAELPTTRHIVDYVYGRVGGTTYAKGPVHEVLGLGPGDCWTWETVRSEVRRIVSKQFSLPEDFSDDARFLEDLDIDS